MKHILLLPFGTSGSVFPFIWLGRRLVERGHRVTMVTSPVYEGSARRAGLGFLAPEGDELEAMLADPAMWMPERGARVGFEHAGRAAASINAAVGRVIAESGRPDLMLAPMITFGARMAREKHRIPLITVHLYPAAMMSAAEVPLVYSSICLLRLLPYWLRKACFNLPSPFDKFALPAIRKACLDIGVPPPRRLWKEWHHSPDGVLALYPDWFGSPQPDWPHNTFQWDFPLEDMAQERPLEAKLAQFLDAGEAPVIFTAGSGNFHVRAFFETAAKLVRHIGCRAVFLTKAVDQVPPELPDSIIVCAYAPFSQILPRSRVMVHHGGIGTLSQCLKAGVPQLIVAMSLDQPDNAERIEKIGAGLGMKSTRFNFDKALPLLQRCLNDKTFRLHAGKYAGRLQHQPKIEGLMQWLESASFLHS